MADVGDTISFHVPKNMLGDLLAGSDVTLEDPEDGTSMCVEVVEIIPRKDSLELTAIVRSKKGD